MARVSALARSAPAIAALILAAAPAHAQTAAPAPTAAPNWSRVQDVAQFAVLLDLNSIRPAADEPGHAKLVDGTGLLDFKVAQIVGDHQVSSVTYLLRFDCAQKQLKLLHSNNYEQNMATGRIVNADDATDPWHAPDPQTPELTLLTAACAVK
jgi:hypothetical protein